MIDPVLRGKVAIVTGGNHGIGAATAQALAAQRVSVFITYLRLHANDGSSDSDVILPRRALYHLRQSVPGEEVVDRIRAAGRQAASWEADLSDPDIIPQLFDRAESAFGPVDIVVNNAAHSERDTFAPLKHEEASADGYRVEAFTAASHDWHFAVNSRAPALMMAEYARRHVARGASWGRIINVSTDAAAGAPNEVSYWASKHALESYTRSAALELARHGITINIVAPGPIQTGWIPPHLEEELAKSTPLGRIGQPSDVADVIVFLASEQARWLTGQLLYVGGGHRMHQ